MTQNNRLRRRDALAVLGGSLATAGMVTYAPGEAWATVEKADKLLKELTGGKTPQSGKVVLDAPQIAENGTSVPITVSVDSPMTPENHCKAVHILSDGNPEAGVCTFRFTAMSGKAEISTRMRMAQTQNVWAVAELSDGSLWMTKSEVKVTIGGCGG